MYRLYVGTFSLLTLSLALGPAAPVPTHLMPKNEFYYATTVGTKWVYQHKEATELTTYVITEVKDRDETKLVSVGVEDKRKILPYSEVAVSKQGLVQRLRLWGIESHKPSNLLKLPYRKDLKWDDSTDLHTIRSTQFAAEEVKVPAGTFQAIKVTTFWRYERPPGGPVFNGPDSSWENCWYAAGVGLVKRDNGTRDSVTVLKSFTIGTPASEK